MDETPQVKKQLVNFTNTPPEVMNGHIIPQVVAMVLAGANILEISREMNMNRGTVRKIMASYRFKELLDKANEGALKNAVAQARTGMAKLVNKALKVIEDNLDDGKLEAVKIVMKGLGLDTEEQKVQDTNLTVILPGAKQETVIDVTSEEDNANG